MSLEMSSIKEQPWSTNCRVYDRTDADFEAHAYQYGSTSHRKKDMIPSAIVYPACVADITLAVNWACQHDVGIAVRTGGHQYSGVSSTSGQNIQLDMSDTFQSEKDFEYLKNVSNVLRVGISFSLLEMNKRLHKEKLFLPHGQCVHVHLGGHVQTGGYGQLGRAFGLLSDHVEGFEIVIGSGQLKYIFRPGSLLAEQYKESIDNELNDKLFEAVLGGSPGNYGILTHVYLTPHKDVDYPNSRGMKLITFYTPDKLKKIVQVLSEFNDAKDLPGDFDVCVTVMSDPTNCSVLGFKATWLSYIYRILPSWFTGFFLFQWIIHWMWPYKTVDEEMMYEHPEDYADGAGKRNESGNPALNPPFSVITIFLQWANLGGDEQQFGEKEKEWFEKFRKASSPNLHDHTIEENCKGWPADYIKKMVDFIKFILYHASYMQVDYKEHIPLSQLTRYWCYENVREFDKPYEKRCYPSNFNDLSTNGYVKWICKSIDKVVNQKDKEIDVVAQIQPFGGKNSRFYLNDKSGCHSWRKEITMITTIDCFYQPGENAEGKNRLNWALKWQKENDTGARQYVCKQDRRLLWATFAAMDDPDAGSNLHSVRSKYFDSEEKYQKLVQIKKEVDPHFIFTSNMFSVGAIDAPNNRKIYIKGLGHE